MRMFFRVFRIPFRDAMVAVTIGRDQGAIRQEADLGHALDVIGVQAAFGAIGRSDFPQEFSVPVKCRMKLSCHTPGPPPADSSAAAAGRRANCSALPGAGPGCPAPLAPIQTVPSGPTVTPWFDVGQSWFGTVLAASSRPQDTITLPAG